MDVKCSFTDGGGTTWGSNGSCLDLCSPRIPSKLGTCMFFCQLGFVSISPWEMHPGGCAVVGKITDLWAPNHGRRPAAQRLKKACTPHACNLDAWTLLPQANREGGGECFHLRDRALSVDPQPDLGPVWPCFITSTPFWVDLSLSLLSEKRKLTIFSQSTDNNFILKGSLNYSK